MKSKPPIRSVRPSSHPSPPSHRSHSAPPQPAPVMPSMQDIIRPTLRDRWLFGDLTNWTPAQLQNTIASAMSGNIYYMLNLYDLMISSWDRLSTNLRKISDAVSTLDWDVQPYCAEGQDPDPEAIRRAQLFEAAIWTMRPKPAADESGFGATVLDLADAFAKGIAVSEIHWEQRDINGTTMIAPRCTKHLPPRFLAYPPTDDQMDRLGLNAVQVNLSSSSGPSVPSVPFCDFPDNKFLVAILKSKSGHPITSGLLRTLGFWWIARTFSAQWFLNLAQIFGIPIRWATHSPDASETTLAVLDSFLENLGSAGWARFPEGVKLELKEASGNSAGNPTESLINLADRICDITILGQTLTSDVQSSGSRALGDVHKNVEDKIKFQIAAKLAVILNEQLVPAFWRLNFGDDKYHASFLPISRDKEDPTKLAAWVKLVAGIFPVSKSWAYETCGVPMPGPADETIYLTAPVFGIPGDPANPSSQSDSQPISASAPSAPSAVNSHPSDLAAARHSPSVADALRRDVGHLRQIILSAPNSQVALAKCERYLSSHALPETTAAIQPALQDAAQS